MRQYPSLSLPPPCGLFGRHEEDRRLLVEILFSLIARSLMGTSEWRDGIRQPGVYVANLSPRDGKVGWHGWPYSTPAGHSRKPPVRNTVNLNFLNYIHTRLPMVSHGVYGKIGTSLIPHPLSHRHAESGKLPCSRQPLTCRWRSHSSGATSIVVG